MLERERLLEFTHDSGTPIWRSSFSIFEVNQTYREKFPKGHTLACS
jgi:hypothetical protein